MRNVAVISVGYNGKFTAKRPDVNIPELIRPAVENALGKTKAKLSDIEAVVEGNMTPFEGVNYPYLWMSDHAGMVGKPVMSISTGGTTGMSVFQAAYYHVASGLFDTVMAVAWEKHDEGDVQIGLGGIVLPEIFVLAQFGPDMSSGTGGSGLGVGSGSGGSSAAASFQAGSYLAHAGGDAEHIDMMAAQARSNAAKNPYAHLQHPNCTKEDIAKTPMIAWPLRYGHTCPSSCGACVVILCAEEKAKKFAQTDRVAWVKAVGTATTDATTGNLIDGQILDPAEQAHCTAMVKKLYQRAGIKNPKKEVQMTEVYDGFAHQELMWPEKLLLVENSCRAIEQGRLAIEGDMPVNPSGGVVSTNAIGASALIRAAECSLQIMGLAEGGHQVPRRIKNAVAHGWGGLFQFVTVCILSDAPKKG